jgi:hypothetical protein
MADKSRAQGREKSKIEQGQNTPPFVKNIFKHYLHR